MTKKNRIHNNVAELVDATPVKHFCQYDSFQTGTKLNLRSLQKTAHFDKKKTCGVQYFGHIKFKSLYDEIKGGKTDP